MNNGLHLPYLTPTNCIWSHNGRPDRNPLQQKQQRVPSFPSVHHQNTLKATPPSPPPSFYSPSISHWGQPETSSLCDQTLSVHPLNPEPTPVELKRIGGRPRNISRVLDNRADVPDGCSTNINTTTNILQYRECQINANRWEDQIHLHLYLSRSSIKSASHWFSQANSLHDYQLSLKLFMIVTVTSVESNALHLADIK